MAAFGTTSVAMLDFDRVYSAETWAILINCSGESSESLPLLGSNLNELLDPLSLVCFRNEDISLRVHGEIVRTIELSCPMPGPAERIEHFERFAIQHIHLLIRSVVHERKPLLRIDREADIPYRSATERILGDEGFLYKCAVLSKDLKAIIGAVANVHEAVMRDLNGVNDSKLGRGRTGRIILARFIFMLHGAAEG